MSPLLISLGAGGLIGLIYSLLKVQSPAPPAVALVGLLGMVVGSTLGGKLLHNEASAWIPSRSQTSSIAVLQPASPQPITQQAG
jgi:XapX domain-containing protein